ncbi:antirestriction Ral family protein [Escherichia coli]|nr:antirestriction Ral family protein [Escherichia coli]
MIWQPEFTDKTLSRKTGAVQEDGKYVDKWAIRTTAMIARELGKQNNKAA